MATVWFDAAAPPQAVWFAGLLPALRRAGHDAVVTCRSSAGTADVVRLVLGEPAAIVDGHAGRGRLRKAGAIASRAGALAAWARHDLADRADVRVVCHNSYAQLVAARLLGIAALTSMDYEGQPANHVAFRAARRVLLPEAFSVEVARRQGAVDRKRVAYPGLKEAVALAAALDGEGHLAAGRAPSGALARWAGLDEPLAVVRPEAPYAAYHVDGDGLTDAVVTRLRSLDCHVVLLPRGPEQATALRSRWPGDDRVEICEEAVNGIALLQQAAVVVGAGGTMTREAALLGTPAYCVFRGSVPAVDLVLERSGRLTRLTNVEAVGRLRLTQRRPPATDEIRRTRDAVVAEVTRFLDAPHDRGRPVVVAWMDADARAEGLAARVGSDVLLQSRAGRLPSRYLAGSVRTFLAARRAAATVVTNPPVVAVLAAAAASDRVVVDHHAGAFNDPRWRWALPLVRLVERRIRAHVVHDDEQAVEARSRFRRPVLVAKGSPVAPSWARAIEPGSGPADVVVVASHSFDEPIAQVIAAARRLPHVRVLVTGRPRDPLALDPPSNVSLPGYLPADDYWRALGGARLVVSLTTRGGTMQQGGYDALDLGRPLVTSDTTALRRFFGDAALYADPSADSIADAIEKALADDDRLLAAANARRTRWEDEVAVQLAELQPFLA